MSESVIDDGESLLPVFRMVWPVTDPALPLGELVAQARPELFAVARRAGVTLLRHTAWWSLTADARRLVVECQAVPRGRHRAHLAEANAAARERRSLGEARECSEPGCWRFAAGDDGVCRPCRERARSAKRRAS